VHKRPQHGSFGLIQLALKQRRDQKSAQQEEEADGKPERKLGGAPDLSQEGIRTLLIDGMKEKNTEKGKKSEDI
jgi:hypothetical protein